MANEKVAAGVAKILAAAKSIATRYSTKKLTAILKKDRTAIQEGLNDIGDADVPQLIIARPTGVPAPSPDPEAPGVLNPLLSLTPGTTTVVANVSAEAGSGRSIVAYEVQRLIGSTWTTVSAADPVTASTVPARSTKTPTKYVHASGSLGGNGAYTTIQAAANAAVAGDEIVVDGTFNEQVLITASGTALNPIRFRAWNYDSKPVVDGSGVSVGWDNSEGSAHLVAIAGEHVIWDGIDIQDSGEHGIGIGDVANNGFFISNSSSWHEGLKVIRTKVRNCPGVGVTMLMTQSAYFGDCDFSECQRGTYWEHAAGNPSGWGYAVQLSGRDPWMDECIVRETMGEGIHVGHHNQYLGGPSRALGCNGFRITGCTIYDCWSAPVYFTCCANGLVERNLVFISDDDRFWWARDNASGYPQSRIGFGSELGAFGNPTQVFDLSYAGVENVVFRNNIINGGMRMLQFANFDAAGNYRNIDIEHNTIFCTKGAFPSVYEALQNGATAADNDMTGIRFRNNAVLVSDSSDISITWNALGSGKVVQGNLFSHSPPSDLAAGTNIVNSAATVITDKTYSLTGVTWPSTKTFDLSKAAPFYNSSTISPLANAAASIGTTTDYYGRTRPTTSGNVDIGAISLSKTGTYALTVSGLSSGTQYQFRVRFREDNGTYSEYSDAEITTTS